MKTSSSILKDPVSMASSSSSSIMASPAPNANSYDVFLSFRGEDTRHSFTDHLYKELTQAGISTFRDNEDINRGEELKPEIEKAIKESRASIVVLSQSYATSSWCLDELMLILEQRKECNQLVLPVFYHVDPSDVGKHNKTFAIQVKDSSRWTEYNVNLWKKALEEVALLAGLILSGPETEFLKKIVDTIYNKLDYKKFHLPVNLTGMATRYKDIKSFINEPNVNFLAICGMGGSGKTTLAKYIYNSSWRSFDNMSFLEEISDRCKRYDDLLQLQEQLLNDILGGKNRRIPSVSQVTCRIEEALQTKRVFIVLDDITDHRQLVTLLGTGKINAQSKIIITSRVLITDQWFESRSWRCQKYTIRLLNDDESLSLLCDHALISKFPTEGFKKLALQALHYCEGNPLALAMLGRLLAEENSIPFWESTLRSLEKEIVSGIQCILLRSYELLPHESNRQLFLHIACFFIGKDKDYVEKILEPDYYAISGIKILSNRFLLSVSPNNKLMMHSLLQEMGKDIVRQEALKFPAKRSRVWLNSDSYKILTKGEGSETLEGLALDLEMLRTEVPVKSLDLKTDALNKMDKLKLLHLNFVYLDGSYQNVSEDLRWLCWFGFHLKTIPSDLSMGKLVAIDMSYSNLEVFELPMVLQSLKILNLKDSYNLFEIRKLSRIPHLETLILWSCHRLVYICETIGELKNLSVLNMTGCKSLFMMEHTNLLVGLEAFAFSRGVEKQPTFSFPHSIRQLFLKDCNLECTDSFPLSFSVQLSLEYLNLCNSLFEFLPCYNHLRNLRVLDLSFCTRLKWLLCLPSTLAELYVYYCTLLERITFESPRFTLQEFGYEGCISLCEIEGFIKLVPVAKLEENDLGHMKWLKEYQNHEVCLIGDDELTKGRSSCIQMLYEFDIMSTSLPDIKDPNMKPTYVSEFSSLYFNVPSDPENRKIKGLDVTFRYKILSDDCAWFCKISSTNGVDFMYNPKVFGKPDSDEVGIWLSYWPIGNNLNVGDIVNVSIVVKSGLEVHGCGVSLVYTDDKVAEEILENNKGWVEILGGNLSGFQLSTGSYYLCRRDFFELMEVDRLTPDWFRNLVGDTIHFIGWRKTGRPKQLNQSFTELKTVRCIIHGPELEEIYKIPEMSKSSFVDRTLEFPSSMLGKTMKSTRSFNSSDTTIKEIVLGVNLRSQTQKQEVIEALSQLQGIHSIHVDTEDGRLTVIGDLDPVNVVNCVSKIETAKVISVGPAKKHNSDVGTAFTSAKKRRSSTSSTSYIFGSRSTVTDQDRLS
ncbi:disease resistance protein RUN1 isoform X2 [Lactuca sativa]|uniref:disease resistance protein RUN1 isoform X2 n=1 Tax=Lactuca sativa TaxID=4236 RepID=UPI001C68AC0D|nr:disease resistance protein RUN1 isoform X2 [Lactuca sativa]